MLLGELAHDRRHVGVAAALRRGARRLRGLLLRLGTRLVLRVRLLLGLGGRGGGGRGGSRLLLRDLLGLLGLALLGLGGLLELLGLRRVLGGVAVERRGLVGRAARGGARGGRVADDGQHGADLDGLVLLDLDLEDGARDGGGDLGVDLVGGDLEQRLVHLDGVADGLEPGGDGALGDALAELGKGDGRCHDVVLVVRVRRASGGACRPGRGQPRREPRSGWGARGSAARRPRGRPPS